MKKTLAICLLLTTTFSATAQQKPTKEETIALISRTTALSIGKPYMNSSLIVTESKFTYDSYSFADKFQEQEGITKLTYSGISWETLRPNEITLEREYGGLGTVSVRFKKAIKYERAQTGSETEILEFHAIKMVIPPEQFESIKNACLRLAEIAKEESFDETVKYVNNKIACCSEVKTATIKGTISGNVSWLAGGLYSGSRQINFFDLVDTKGSYGSTTILESDGMRLFKTSIYCISFQVDSDNVEYLNDFKSQADAERVYKALVQLRSLCTKEKDPFDN